MALSENIRIFRKEAGLTQKALARKSGLSFSMVSKLESGEQSNPSYETIKKIADVLYISPGELLSSPPTIEDQIDEYLAYKRGLSRNKSKHGSIHKNGSHENPCADLNFRKRLQAINTMPEPFGHTYESYSDDPDLPPEMKKLLTVMKNATKDEIIQVTKLFETLRHV
jgi:transcriptional regulator with XRE-family HTH domain